jgi:hypothetical protein
VVRLSCGPSGAAQCRFAAPPKRRTDETLHRRNAETPKRRTAETPKRRTAAWARIAKEGFQRIERLSVVF